MPPLINHNHSRPFVPVRGGVAIQNPAVGEVGTLGFAVTDGRDFWLVSCYHVICRRNGSFPAGAKEAVVLPFSSVDAVVIAEITDYRISRELDCAAAHLTRAYSGEILCVGTLGKLATAKVGNRVLKSGAATGVTEGRIVSIAPDKIEITCDKFPCDYELTKPGDSGSLWIDADSRSPVGLHYFGNREGGTEWALARPITAVLEFLRPLTLETSQV